LRSGDLSPIPTSCPASPTSLFTALISLQFSLPLPLFCPIHDIKSAGSYSIAQFAPDLEGGEPRAWARPQPCRQIHPFDTEIKMSFGYSLGDFVLVTQLAYSVVQNTRKACGAHSALAREVNSLHVVLVRLESEVENERSILNGGSEYGSDVKRQELAGLVRDCERVLRVLKAVLEKIRTDCPYTGWGE